MPRLSEKRKLIKVLEKSAIEDLLLIELFYEESEEKKRKEEEVMDDLLMVFVLAEECRYSVPFCQNIVPKSKYFLTDVLWNMDENRFKVFTRVTRATFQVLVALIKDDECFNQVRSCKQLPIETQLVIALYRLGSCGEGASLSKIAALFGVGDGGTIQNITDRVFNALLKHKENYIFWPNALERKELAAKTFTELPNCIGYVDGTEIPLAEKPSYDPEAFFSRKHVYSMKVQAVCDSSLQIRHLVLGYPGSVHDARIYNECDLATKPADFFSDAEWIAGDSAYKISKYVITPFRENSRDLNATQRKYFNQKFSKYRVRIEHCFGQLKERFNSLKSLKIQIKNIEGIKRANKWILCCVFLQNIILQQNDNFDFELQDQDDVDFDITYSSSTNTEGENKRREICEMLQNLENY